MFMGLLMGIQAVNCGFQDETVSSGLEVAKAASVVATTTFGTRRWSAAPRMDLRNASPPAAANSTAPRINVRSVMATGQAPRAGRR